jgi:hypothetical protein
VRVEQTGYLMERCPCGAEFAGHAYSLSGAKVLLEEFRQMHEPCRRAVAKRLEREAIDMPDLVRGDGSPVEWGGS